ncbi:MAG: hypothetical protein ABIG84_07035 [archaeon]
MHPLFILWAVLAILAFITCLKYPGKLYIYLTAGLAAAAFMALIGASIGFQLVLGILVTITAIIFGEAGIHAALFAFLALDLAVILIYYFLFRQ